MTDHAERSTHDSPGIAGRVAARIARNPAPLIAAMAVLAVGVVARDVRLRRGGGRMLVLEVARRAVEGALGHDEDAAAGGMATVAPAAAAWAAGMLADRLFGAEPVVDAA